MPEEVVLALPPRFDAVKHVRSTLLMSSYDGLREAGYDQVYRAALPKEHHSAIFEAIAGTWIPVEVAIAHYEACGALHLSHDQQLALGRGVSKKIEGTILGTAVRMAKEAGVTPWSLVPQFPRLWSRAFDGGGLYVERRGPKEAYFEVHKMPLAGCPYWRAALCGFGMAMIELFCRKAYVNETTKKRIPGYASVRIQWA